MGEDYRIFYGPNYEFSLISAPVLGPMIDHFQEATGLDNEFRLFMLVSSLLV